MLAAQPDPTWHTTLAHRFGKVSVTVLGVDGQPLSEETDAPPSAFGGASPFRNEQRRNAITDRVEQ